MKRFFRIDRLFCTFLLTLIISSCILRPGIDQSKLKGDIHAVFNTSKGKIVIELFYKDAPLTVTNFIGLAEGTKDSNKPKGTHFYDGTIFYSVIEDGLIQGGSPDGSAGGGPGYTFPREFSPNLKHDEPGILSMANAGNKANGSQFFIIRKAVPWFDNKYSVFGKVVSGLDVVNAIREGDTLKSVQILRTGADVQEFKADQEAFNRLKKAAEKNIAMKKQQEAEKLAAFVKEKWPKAKKTSSGLWYVITKKGHGPKPKKGQKITINYEGKLFDNKLFLSSSFNSKPLTLNVGMKEVIRAWDDTLLDMKLGEKRTIISPYDLAYGEEGLAHQVPPNTNVIFELEIIAFK